jgi:hypothetical protein
MFLSWQSLKIQFKIEVLIYLDTDEPYLAKKVECFGGNYTTWFHFYYKSGIHKIISYVYALEM